MRLNSSAIIFVNIVTPDFPHFGGFIDFLFFTVVPASGIHVKLKLHAKSFFFEGNV